MSLFFFGKYNDLITKEVSSTTSQNHQLYLEDSTTRKSEDAITLSLPIISGFLLDPSIEDQHLYTLSRNPDYKKIPPL